MTQENKKRSSVLIPDLVIPVSTKPCRNDGAQNKILPEDRAAHDWYRFVLSFPPHLVREYLQRFGMNRHKRVLDPFCGTGTTLVECKKLGIPSVGIEATPMAHYASRVKVDWRPNAEELSEHAREVADLALKNLRSEGIKDGLFSANRDTGRLSLRGLPAAQMDLLLEGSISPLPLHKALVLLDCINALRKEVFYHHERLALAKALVHVIGNLEFGPEVGVGARKPDAMVVSSWMDCVTAMTHDLRELHPLNATAAVVHRADSRQLVNLLEPRSVNAVITSPPYPNEKDYTRATRLESVILGFVQNKVDLRAIKKELVRSNTRSVYADDDDDRLIADHPEIQRLADAIETRRKDLGKTSGFERLYAKVTRLYFGGMARHLASLRTLLRPGAFLAYVVGDQASYLRVMIRTGQLLADIAREMGYDVVSIDLFRTRLATATREQLREEVVVLRWPG